MNLNRIKKHFRKFLENKANHDFLKLFDLQPPLPLPGKFSEDELYTFVASVCVEGAPAEEMKNYCKADFRRFVYTLGLIPNTPGTLLEIDANPYFTTMLIKKFRNYEMRLINYFDHVSRHTSQRVFYQDLDGEHKVEEFHFENVNIEQDTFPYPDNFFDVVLFCEVIEHLLIDPIHAIREIKRVLKENGILILSTPNVARLENVARLLSGAN